MTKSRMMKYSGDLSLAQIAHGMNAARRNARRLADDAKLLLDSGRYPTAAAIAALSIEESGKTSVLRGLALSPNVDVRRRAWKDYRSHRSKNAAWILPELAAKGARDLDSLRPATDSSAEHTALLDQLKQIGFYTDCLGNAHWSEPANVIDEELARSLVGIAHLLANEKAVTEREMELWVEHMRPVYGAPLDLMKAALLNWFAAMRQNGLWEDGDIGVDGFVWGETTLQMLREFWEGFAAFVAREGEIVTKIESPSPQHWLGICGVGRPGFYLYGVVCTWSASGVHELRAELIIDDHDADYYFDLLHADRRDVEKEHGFSDEMEWYNPIGVQHRKIYWRLPTDFGDRELRTDQYRWLLERSEALHRILSPRVRALPVPK
ncbi:MAG: AbiV family abortive infection protein [Gemmatimonadota bacterium]|nr:AbiV family abortive infection protein [Gemmatimonadota bacterium]